MMCHNNAGCSRNAEVNVGLLWAWLWQGLLCLVSA